MAARDIIVIGGSAGSIEALRTLVAALPADLPAAVFVVIHLAPYSTSTLPKVLSDAGPLPAKHPRDGEAVQRGLIYVAPPDHHILLEGERVLLRRGPKENRNRPSIDALFRSAAYVCGPRVIGVVLSGVLDDGTSGLWSIKRLGGLTIAQTPEEAIHPEMPQSAIDQVEIDHVAGAAEIGVLLGQLVGTPVEEQVPIAREELRRVGAEIDIAARSGAFDKGIMQWGDIAPFTCPDCHGTLVRFDEGSSLRFRCHTGHAFTPRALLAGITEAVENTLWQAKRGLDEQTAMLEYLAEHFGHGEYAEKAALFASNARESHERAVAVEDCLPRQQQLGDEVGH